MAKNTFASRTWYGFTPAPIVPAPAAPAAFTFQPSNAGTLANSPAEIVQWLLIKLGLATDPANTSTQPWPAYSTGEPSSPDNCITVYDTTGQDFGRSQLDGEVLYHHGFQVRVRASEHPAGWIKANAIRIKLSGGVRQVVVSIPPDGTKSSYLVYNINRIGPVLTLGKETPQSRRSLFTLNAMLVVRQLA